MRIATILDRRRLGASIVLIMAVLVAACSPAASPIPSPSPTTAPTPTLAPTASAPPSASAAPSASVAIKDPTVDLKIGDPYALAPLDPATETAIRQQITGSLGSFGSIFDIGVRQVIDNGQQAGIVLVMGFPTGVLSETAYKGALAGLQSSLDVTLTPTDVGGTELSSGSNATAGYAAYHDGDNLVFVLVPPAGAKADAIGKALISANS